jgi:hypothetical protein
MKWLLAEAIAFKVSLREGISSLAPQSRVSGAVARTVSNPVRRAFRMQRGESMKESVIGGMLKASRQGPEAGSFARAIILDERKDAVILGVYPNLTV